MKNIFAFLPLIFALNTQAKVVLDAPLTSCLAIRGNGELQPAHWGAVARSIEEFGEPSAVAGGSSASITSFLIENIAQYPAATPEKMSFLMKSVQGILNAESQNKEWLAVKEILNFGKIQKAKYQVGDLIEIINNPKFMKEVLVYRADLTKALRVLEDSKIFFGPAVQAIKETINRLKAEKASGAAKPEALAKLNLQVEHLKQSADALGKYNAKTDTPIFVRDGFISFPALAAAIGRLGDFLSLEQASKITRAKSFAWMDECSKNSKGKLWDEIVQEKPQCETELAEIVKSYRMDKPSEQPGYRSSIQWNVGARLHSLISTSVVTGDLAKLYIEQKQNFDSGKPIAALAPQTADVQFGYFGMAADLNKVSHVLKDKSFAYADLDKSKRFMQLPTATWFEVLSASPAEPGLSGYVPLRIDPKGSWDVALSFGGWSDLHPTVVLKALGCQHITYLTRSGEDSQFAQQIAERLMGDLEQFEDKMFNLSNPKSSFAASLAAADAVLCSNWNSFKIQNGAGPLVADAYRAPMLNPKQPGSIAYLGCLPQ